MSKVIVVIIASAIIGIYLGYALIPAAKAGATTRHAMQQFVHPHKLLDKAAEQDLLDPSALTLNSKLYLLRYKDTADSQPALLKQAVKCLLIAIERNKADFKNYEKLSEVYNLLAETPTEQTNTWLNKAFDTASLAVRHYPGCGRLRIKSAQIAEKLGKSNIALEQYKKAIRIEDQYRRQFQLMYPGQKIFSRLGEKKYRTAKQKVKQLTEKPTP